MRTLYIAITAAILLASGLFVGQAITFCNNPEKENFFINFEGNTNLDPSFMEAFNTFVLFKGKSRREILNLWKLRGFDSKESFQLVDTSKSDTWVLYIPKEGDIGYGYVFNEDSFYSISLIKLSYINFPKLETDSP